MSPPTDPACPLYFNFSQLVNKLLIAIKPHPSTIILSLVYMERLRSKSASDSSAPVSTPGVSSRGNPQYIWVATFMLADTMTNDNALSMSSWSSVIGLPNPLCVRLRRDMLECLEYNLVPKDHEMEFWRETLETRMVALLMIQQQQQQQQQAQHMQREEMDMEMYEEQEEEEQDLRTTATTTGYHTPSSTPSPRVHTTDLSMKSLTSSSPSSSSLPFRPQTLPTPPTSPSSIIL
jgi:hypothetical protein